MKDECNNCHKSQIMIKELLNRCINYEITMKQLKSDLEKIDRLTYEKDMFYMEDMCVELSDKIKFNTMKYVFNVLKIYKSNNY